MIPHLVAVLALPGVVAFELATPSRIFESAHEPDATPLYQVATCTLDGRPVQTSGDLRVEVDHGPELLARAGTVVIPASLTVQQAIERNGVLPTEIAEALAQVRPGTRMVSLCTGAYVLAAAGLLDGRPATTHWLHTEALGRLFPLVRLDTDALFVDDGDVLTSGGVAAGIDLCLHIIRRDHGSGVANRASRQCVVPPRRDGGQAQYVDLAAPDPAETGTAPARAYAQDHLGEPLSLSMLAALCDMSTRTFTRRFREETGLSPGQWLVRRRAARARELLEQTDLTVDRVAAEVGFGTAASMRRLLHDTLGVSPTAYRRTFRQGG